MDDHGDGGARKGFLIRLRPDIKKRLRVDAGRHDRSMSAHIEHLIDEHTPTLDGEPTRAAG